MIRAKIYRLPYGYSVVQFIEMDEDARGKEGLADADVWGMTSFCEPWRNRSSRTWYVPGNDKSKDHKPVVCTNEEADILKELIRAYNSKKDASGAVDEPVTVEVAE